MLILFVFLPLNLIITSIKAINGNTEIINLYPVNFIIENSDESFQNGWWNTEKLVGDIDLSPSAGLIEFSDINSAFYSGGNADLVLSGFRFLEDELNFVATEKNNQYSEENNQYMSDIVTEVEIMENTVEEPLKEIQDGEQEESVSELVEDTQAEIGDEQEQEKEQEKVKIVEPKSDNSAEVFIEIFEESVEESTVEVITEKEDNVREREISWLKKMKHSFAVLAVRAQEEIKDKLSSLSDLGEFKKAKIKFSFAMNANWESGIGNPASAEATAGKQELGIDEDVFEDLEIEMKEDSEDDDKLFDVEFEIL